MRHPRTMLGCLIVLAACGDGENDARSGGHAPGDEALAAIPGIIDLHWDETGGRLLIQIDAFDRPFLYRTSLARGVGDLQSPRVGPARIPDRRSRGVAP